MFHNCKCVCKLAQVRASDLRKLRENQILKMSLEIMGSKGSMIARLLLMLVFGRDQSGYKDTLPLSQGLFGEVSARGY